ncbi:hypothetical protein CYMTET_29800 [Cymbomonas tetramitiformis]|uniref:Protein kinase domain-containing protein n=1 Tax=Cymbomonas tetramitiformis TaxID=36881 RepID=A0AAE0KUK6_9CHLO|nr:hypothetical protein CYMTET_29800 [Cymbomonas tetramitiformis]
MWREAELAAEWRPWAPAGGPAGDAVALVNPTLCQDAPGLQFYFYLVTPCVEVEAAGSAGDLHRAEVALQIRGSINASGNRIETFYDISGKKLGSGGYAEVYQATDRESGRQCAVKIMTKQKLQFLGTTVDAVQREAEVMSQIEHPSVLRLYDVFTSPVAVFLVVELVEGGDLLERLLQAVDPYTEDRARILLRNLIEAIGYLHEQNVVHRDLKPENILMLSKESDVDIKIADFGMAKKFSTTGGLKTFCGTPNYVAPEVLQRMDSEQREGSYSEAADMWSAGVIMYIVLVREQPFCEANDQLYDNIKAGNFIRRNVNYAKLSGAAKSLITSLLTVHPEDRLSADAALQHAWFANPAATTRRPGGWARATGSRPLSAAGPSESPLDAHCTSSPQVSSYMPASKRVKHH